MGRLDQVGRWAIGDIDFSRLTIEEGRQVNAALGAAINPIDDANVEALLKIMPKEGWFTITEVGQEASAAAFHIVQHSDLALQKLVLPRIEPLVANGEIEGNDYAAMFDRIATSYFDITGGRERWLYRVARKHAGGAGEGGFAISMPVLFEKSGAEGQYRRFKFEMLKLAEKNALPGYALAVEAAARGGEPLPRMIRVDGKDGAERRLAVERGQDSAGQGGDVSPGKHAPAPELLDASALIRGAVNGLADKAHRGQMEEGTTLHLRETCPGWDLYALHAEFERWVDADPQRLPANWQKAFIGWVKRHHAKHGQTLR